MFRRKQDVDRHVNSILLRKRDEKERNAQGYQIAKLYADIKEYSVAKRYLSGFLSVRENVPSAYQLMGEISEGLGQKEIAIDNFKRALELGDFVSSNKYLVQKICKLYTEIGTDVRRMEHWLEKLEKLDPKNDMIFKLKAQIAEVGSANGENKDEEMENVISSEMVKRPTDLKLRIKLLKLYLNKNRCDEAYDVAVTCDLTTAFATALPWYECLYTVFKKYGEINQDTQTDFEYNQHYLSVLRNLVYLSLPAKELDDCVKALSRFDQQLKCAVNMANSNETWAAMLKEMKGQIFFLASLILLKRAQIGSVSWQDVNHLSGACVLASKSMDPLDAQAPWFVSAPATHRKFYDWWHQQSYDRLSQVGHMLGQLSQKKKWDDVTEWGLHVRRDTMTSIGHQRVFEQLYGAREARAQSGNSFLYQAQEMVAGQVREKEPFTQQHLLDIDRVAYQVHLGELNHLMWLCLQRYSADMNAQPNYHFTLMENIQFSVKNLEDTAAETLSQLDILVFLLTSVRCAATAISENTLRYADSSGRPIMLPVCLAKPLCSPEQDEWWTAAFRFCTNNIKDDFSRLRRVLVRGLETVRLVGSHGVSVKMMCHLARSLDARAKSFRAGQHGCRCSAYDLDQLEKRAVFYWEKAKLGLQRTQHMPMPKNRLFKEAGDTDLSPLMSRPLLEEALFALAVHDMNADRLEEAIHGFKKLNSPYAKFYSAKIYKMLSDREPDSEESLQKKTALASKARDCLYDTIDGLEGDKSHELNVPVYKELDELNVMLHALELDERIASPSSSSFHTPVKSPSEIRTGPSAVPSFNGKGFMGHSTPRQSSSKTKGAARYTNGRNPAEADEVLEDPDISSSSDHYELTAIRPRPSPERLDAQLKSVSYSQSSMFKMVLERNDELIVINSKLMEELRDNNNQLKTMLSENQDLMSGLKTFLGENRDMMKQIKTELSELKQGIAQQAAAPIAPTPPLYLPPHMAGVPPRGPPYPGFPPPAYPPGPGYMINSPMPGPAPPRPPPPSAAAAAAAMAQQYRPSGLPGAHTPGVGKYRSPSDEDDEEVDPDDLTSAEEAAALYADYCDEAAYSQYFTPDSQMMQDWTGRSAMEGPPPQLNLGPPAPMPPRMSMPSPGYFASALRGQSLQYAQNTPPPTQVRPPPLGPGFFSSPLTSTGTPATATNTPSLLAALTGQSSGVSPGLGSFAMSTSGVKAETSVPPASTTVNLGPTLSGLKSLFQSKGVLEPTKAKGDVTILVDTNSRRATILMMGETKDIIFHHDIQGLSLEQQTSLVTASPASVVSWTATKIGSAGEREKVSLGLDTPAVAAQLKEAIQRATLLIQPKSVAQGAATTVKVLGNPSATSTPMTAAGSLGLAKPQVQSIFATPSVTATTTTAAKPTFGGFTFSTAPVIAESNTAAAEKPKPETGANKDQTPKPFANFSLTPSAPATHPGTSPLGLSQKSPLAGAGLSRADEDHVEEYEPNVDFKPVIALPELVEKTTGEENETALFVERCRLYRFDQETKQWKERGVGEMKILSSKDEVKFRVIMRRDQIFKLCANHCLSADMKLTPMPSSDRAWCYTANDFSEEKMNLEQLAAKFKNPDKASTFKDCFNKCCQQLKDAGVKSPSKQEETTPTKEDKSTTEKTKETPPKEEATAKPQVSLNELFKPKAGSWECDGCMIRNNGDVDQCPACGTVRPGAQPPPAGQAAAFGANKLGASSGSSGFSFGSKPGSGFTFATPSSTAPSTGSKPATGFVFGAPPASTGTSAAAATGFSFGQPPATTTTSTSGGFKFGAPVTTTTTAAPAATTGFKFGAAPQSKATTTTSTTASTAAPPTGFKFGAPQSTTTTATTTAVQAASSTSSSGFKFGAPVSTPSAGPFMFKPQTVPATTTTTAPATSSTGFSFKPPATLGGTSSSGPAKPALFSFSTTPSSSATTTTTAAASSSTGSGGLLAQLLTSEEEPAQLKQTLPEAPKPSSGGFNFSMAPKPSSTALAGSGASNTSSQGFQFSFTKSPIKPAGSPAKPVVPGSPEVDEHGLYITKEGDDSHIHFEPIVALPDKIEVKTGEEDENILFESRGKLYRFVSGEWKEKGLGVVKILEHKNTKKTRVLMRRDQILKICCNHSITSDLSLQPMANTEGKAWVWYALDFSEQDGKMEQLALRFKTAEIALEFKTVFDKCRENYKASPAKTEEQGRGNVMAIKKELFKADSTTADTETDDDVIFVREEKADNDVMFVREEKPTKEEIAEARKWKLPDCFYLYKYKPPCPGCIGCTDGEYDPQKTSKTQKEPAQPVQSPVISSGASKAIFTAPAQPKPAESKLGQPMFGSTASISPSRPSYASVAANLPDFSKLTPDTKAEESSTAGAGPSSFVFGSKSTVDFSSLAASGSGSEFTWNKQESTGPFSFAGAGQKLFGRASMGGEGEGGGDDGGVAPSEDIHFEPVIPLPDLVQVKTGEEDWKVLFCHRSKLYKFDQKLQQWKERGVGEIKIMQHNTQVMFRVIQRREQVLKVACNHLISPDMKLNPMSTSETAWCWVANDFTEAQASVEQFAIKFKNKELAQEFKTTFEKCQETLRTQGGQSQEATSHKDKSTLASKTLAEEIMIVPSTLNVLERVHVPQLYRNNPDLETMTATISPQQGDKGNRYYSRELYVAGTDIMTSTTSPQHGDKGNPYYSRELDVVGTDIMTSTTFPQQGDKGNPYYSQELDVADIMTSTTSPEQGDKGNPYYSQELDVAGTDIMTSTTSPQQGDKGNPYYSRELNVADIMTSTTSPQQGDNGNRYYSQELDVADIMTSTTSPQQGDKGNPYYNQELDVADIMTSTTSPQQGDKGNPYYSQELDVAGTDIMTSTTSPQKGDIGNRYYCQELDVADIMTSTTSPQQDDKGNRYYSQELDVAGTDIMTSTTSPQQGDNGNPYYSQELDVAGTDIMTSTTSPQQGDKGNRYYSQELDVAGTDIMTSTTSPQQGDKGNRYYSQELDVAGTDIMTSTTSPQQGDKGNRYYSQELDVAGTDMTSTTSPQQGDKGNPYYSQELDVAGTDIMTSTTSPQQGDKGNPYYSQELDVAGTDMTSTTSPQQGDKGNPYYSQELDVAGTDIMTSTTSPQQGDKGNPYYSQELDVVGTDIMTSTTSPQQGDKGNPYYSDILRVEGAVARQPGQHKTSGVDGAPNAPVQAKASPVREEEEREEEEEDYEDEDDDDEEDEDDEEEDVHFEKRATLNLFESGTWKTLGLGTLTVTYNDDITGDCVRFRSDSGVELCNHIISRELFVTYHAKTRSCEWQPIDYSTDEPVRRHFLASFSSPGAATEFRDIFEAGRQLAVESELSEKLTSEIEVPEVFSTGEPTS